MSLSNRSLNDTDLFLARATCLRTIPAGLMQLTPELDGSWPPVQKFSRVFKPGQFWQLKLWTTIFQIYTCGRISTKSIYDQTPEPNLTQPLVYIILKVSQFIYGLL